MARRRLPLQLAGAAAHRRPRRCGARPSARAAIRSGSCSIRSRCSASSWFPRRALDGGGGLGPAGLRATAWPRSSARRSAARACRGTRARAGPGFVAFVALRHARRAAFLIGVDAAAAARRRALHSPRIARRLRCALAAVCALVESLPTTLDDNLTVPLVGALTLPLIALGRAGACSRAIPASPRRVLRRPRASTRVIALARLSARARSTCAGALSAVADRHRDHRRARPARASR